MSREMIFIIGYLAEGIGTCTTCNPATCPNSFRV